LHIYATDINENFVKGTEMLAQQHGWPVTASVMDMYNLSFPDNYFAQSYTSFTLHCSSDGAKAVANIYRTLQPGGKMCAATWVDMPHAETVKKAHWGTRGGDSPMPTLLPRKDYKVDQLKAALKQGGFDESKTESHYVDAYMTSSDTRRWSQLAWSFLGTLPDGWNDDDEEKWDQAVEILEQQVWTGRNAVVENGTLTIKMTAAVGVATK
jgi:SAM-dependent methyltransferase